MAAVRTIAVTNQKGGVGKTTTVANLGAALARRRVNVCLVDLDPQANLTMHFGIDPTALPASAYDVMTAETPLTAAAVLVEPHLTVVPSVIDLAAAEVELAGAVGREQILRDRLAQTGLPYDLVLIDCPPSLGLLTLNALAAAGEVLIPLQPHFLALQGLGKLLQTVHLVRRRVNPDLVVTGVVFCMYESGTRLAGEVVADVTRFFEAARGANEPWSAARVFRSRIRRNIKLAECPSYGTTIFSYEPSSHGAADYEALAEEFFEVFLAAPAQTERRADDAPAPIEGAASVRAPSDSAPPETVPAPDARVEASLADEAAVAPAPRDGVDAEPSQPAPPAAP